MKKTKLNFTKIHHLIFYIILSTSFAYSNNPSTDFSIVTIAKSGTRLIEDTIFLLTGYTPTIDWHLFNKKKPDHLYYFLHFPIENHKIFESYQDFLKKKKIVLIRDLRDVCISLVYHIRKDRWPNFKENLNWFCSLSFDDQLTYILKEDLPIFPISQSFPGAVNYIKDFNPLIIRFENLIGPKGGGSLELQEKEIRKIADFLNLLTTPNEIHEIATSLWGMNALPTEVPVLFTFREGKIGAWKSLFNAEHKRIFKERFNKYLVELGYEQNDQW